MRELSPPSDVGVWKDEQPSGTTVVDFIRIDATHWVTKVLSQRERGKEREKERKKEKRERETSGVPEQMGGDRIIYWLCLESKERINCY